MNEDKIKTFLQITAQDIYAKWGNDLSQTALVFPNKRAGLFINNYLAAESDKPMWSPAYMSINEMLCRMSRYAQGDRIKLTCILYKIFKEETGTQESLDEFYAWGEVLLNDFDNTDKSLADADRLFANIKDLKEIDAGYNFLTPEQTETMKRFFSGFSEKNDTELKRRFISVWNKLTDIYRNYKQELDKRGIAYEGMIYRDVLDHFDAALLPFERYVFIGFNALNKVEREIFRKIDETGKAFFYWDYDVYYLRDIANHEAGAMIRHDKEAFPSQLPEEYFDNFKDNDKRISYISTSNETVQAKYIRQWMNDTVRNDREAQQSVIVLCNESMLLPVLNSIPESVKEMNVTMGYPLSLTPEYTFVRQLMNLHVDYRTANGTFMPKKTMELLSNNIAMLLSDNIATLKDKLKGRSSSGFTPQELCGDEVSDVLFSDACGKTELLCDKILQTLRLMASAYRRLYADDKSMGKQLHEESLFKIYTVITNMKNLIADGELDIGVQAFSRLAGKIMDATSIPFHGEPLAGLQIMGVLETRNLDFKNILMLSVNEGMMPKTPADISFIPYNLRRAFGLQTKENRNAIYAYYFYRLLQRAKDITLMYNASVSGLNKKEMSRFMLQLQAESGLDIAKYHIDSDMHLPGTRTWEVRKDNAIMEKLHSFSHLYASSINTYIDCGVKFYLTYILGIKERKDNAADIDNAMFGTLFHRSMELLYDKLRERDNIIRLEDMEALLKNKAEIESCINKAFKECIYPDEDNFCLNGMQMLKKQVLAKYVVNMLKKDLRKTPFEIVGMERKTFFTMDILTDGKPKTLRLGGYIDRIEKKGDTLIISDYKTGSTEQKFKSAETLFERQKNRSYHWLQVLLYCKAAEADAALSASVSRIVPNLIYIQKNANTENEQESNQAIYGDNKAEFEELLKKTMEELFDREKPFTQTEEEHTCSFCDFRNICGK